MRPATVVVPRWIQLVMLPLAVLGAWALVRAAGGVVLLFTIAALIALLLNPGVSFLRRRRVPRGLAVLAVYLGLIALLVSGGILLADPVASQVSSLQSEVPKLVDHLNTELVDLQAWLDRNQIDVQVAEPGQTAIQTLGERVSKGSGELVSFTRDALTFLVEASLAIILVIVLSVYMLLYGERIGRAIRSVLPEGDGPEDDFPTRMQRAVSGYVRGQFLFSTIMGTSAGLMLWIAGGFGVFAEGRDYALFFGIWFGVAELIPYVGPSIGAAPPVLIALFGGNEADALTLVILFTALQQLEGHVVAPNVFAQALRINPLLVILALLLGAQLYGLIGAFVALPIAAMVRETVVYARRHLVLEPWGTQRPPALAGAGLWEPRADACPECAAAVPEGAAFCPACGTELADPDAAAAAAAAAPG